MKIMSKSKTEEKAPLLFVLDGNSNEDLTGARYCERTRLNGISTGATAVFTRFPDYIGSCWITSAICGLLFFMMFLLILSTMSAVTLRLPRCVSAQNEPINKTIHLIHLHNPNNEMEQVKIIKSLMTFYPDYNIRILSVIDKELSNNIDDNEVDLMKENVTKSNEESFNVSTTTTTTTLKAEKQQATRKRRELDFREANRFLDLLLRGTFLQRTDPIIIEAFNAISTSTAASTIQTVQPQTVEELLKIYPNITYENTTFNQQFFASPLYPYFKYMNEKVKVFAVRVLQIWEYGGITFDLDAPNNLVMDVMRNKYEKVSNFVIFDKEAMSNEKSKKNEKVVISVDERAIHLESNVPCHAFFGQLLMLLRKTDQISSIKHLMRVAIRLFCKHYASNYDNCLKYINI